MAACKPILKTFEVLSSFKKSSLINRFFTAITTLEVSPKCIGRLSDLNSTLFQPPFFSMLV